MFRVHLGVGRVVTFGLSVCFVGLFWAVCVYLCAFVWGKDINVFAEISFFMFLTCSYLVVLETLIRWLKQYCENSVQQIINQDKHAHVHPKNQSRL